jgi:bifunctional non-homologous end joining protein LigD
MLPTSPAPKRSKTSLKAYRAKRHFKQTQEPTGKAHPHQTESLQFVIQKHDATRLHYDFRLQMGGVLKSWAVPKGIPTQRGKMHLAVEVEDHPVEYGTFEGIIPEGNYGAGTVMLWDTGTYEVMGDDPLKQHAQGKLHLVLHGKKLKGEWVLVRLRDQSSDKTHWLLFKSKENAKPISPKLDDTSAISGRNMVQIAQAKTAEWQSNRPDSKGAELRSLFVEPMKPRLVRDLRSGPEWVYELKLDGIRAIAIKKGHEVELFSRNQKLISHEYPHIVEALKKIPCREAVLDGEIVALDSEGRPSFQLLQNRKKPLSKTPIFYYLFDLLRLDHHDWMSRPMLERKRELQTLLNDSDEALRLSANLTGAPDCIAKAVRDLGLEGIIGKRKDSRYEPGQRSGSWLKIKFVLEQEFVIGGYSPPQGSRKYFGAILVGYYEKGKLMFASKVGTGFDHLRLRELYQKFQTLRTEECPFTNVPQPGPGLTRADMRICSWIRPTLVCRVRFSEWTRDGNLRQPVFLGLSEDKAATEVIRERPAN